MKDRQSETLSISTFTLLSLSSFILRYACRLTTREESDTRWRVNDVIRSDRSDKQTTEGNRRPRSHHLQPVQSVCRSFILALGSSFISLCTLPERSPSVARWARDSRSVLHSLGSSLAHRSFVTVKRKELDRVAPPDGRLLPPAGTDRGRT